MNRLCYFIFLIVIFTTSNISSQNRHVLFADFIKSELFLKVIAPEIEKEGYEIFSILGNDTLVSDFSFENLYNNEYYVIREIGIWRIGVNTSHPGDYYLFFKYKNQYYIQNALEPNLILKRFLWFSEKAQLSQTDIIRYLYRITIFLNENNNFPIKNLNE